MPESGNDRSDEGQAIIALVRDQYAQVLGLTVAQTTPFQSSGAPGREPNWPLDATGVQVLRWNRPALALGGHSFPAPTLGRRGA
jgi:hypothetical protein